MSNKEIKKEIKRLADLYECTKEESDYVENQFEDALPFEGGMSISEAIIHIKNTELYEED